MTMRVCAECEAAWNEREWRNVHGYAPETCPRCGTDVDQNAAVFTPEKLEPCAECEATGWTT